MYLNETYRFIFNEISPLYGEREAASLSSAIIRELGYSRTDTIVQENRQIEPQEHQRICQILEELKQFKPLQYILGYVWFLDQKILLSEYTLIPRPETEELCDRIIRYHRDSSPVIIDIGTGSGCIAIALCNHIPNARVIATDNAEKALEQAALNAKKNGATIKFVHHDILREHVLDETADIIVSNPPYVQEKEKSQMHKNVLNYEPSSALFVPDDDPLLYYRAIHDFSLSSLKSSGILYLEINEYLAKETAGLFSDHFRDITIMQDLQGKDRFIKAIRV